MKNDTDSKLFLETLFSKAAAERIAGYGGAAFLLSGLADNMVGAAVGTAAIIALFEAYAATARYHKAVDRSLFGDDQPASGPEPGAN